MKILFIPRFLQYIFQRKIIFSIFLLTITSKMLSAQVTHYANELKVGQVIPEYVWNKSFKSLTLAENKKGTFEKSILKLNEFKGKLIILDFWATWCGACIANFPKAKKLEAMFNDKLSFILVNNEDPVKAQALLQKRLKSDGEKFHYIIEDTLLNRLFFKRLIPHYVWIDGNGKIIAATGPDEVNEKNIASALKSDISSVKNMPDINRELPLFSSPNLPSEHLVKYNILTRGKVAGLGSGFVWRKDSTGTIIGRAITNLPFKYIFEKLWLERKSKENNITADFTSVIYEGKNVPLFNTMFNYEFSVPKRLAPKLDSLVIEDLNTFSPFTISFEKRMTNCLALEIADASKLPLNRSTLTNRLAIVEDSLTKAKILQLNNVKISSLLNLMKNSGAILSNKYIVDLLHSDQEVSLTINFSNSPSEMNKQLEKYGLKVKEVNVELEYAVVRDQKNY